MIADVIGSYLDSLEEREFDAPFMALLRSLGFHDIHFLHGTFEFGKDFIAKGDEGGAAIQYSFQTKAGNVGLAGWNECRGQIDMLRTNSLAHPAFDALLQRKAVFVTTGRLVGAAPLAAQEYGEHLKRLGEAGFVTWDRETLIDRIASSPEVGLATTADGAFLQIIGQVDQISVDEPVIERFSRRWLDGKTPLHTAAIEASVIMNRLRRVSRLDLACYLSLCLVRAAWARGHGTQPVDPTSIMAANAGRQLFTYYTWDLVGRCGDDLFDPLNLVRGHQPISAHVTYPVRCLRLVEILGLLLLLEKDTDDPKLRSLSEFVVNFIAANPGVAHPISDRWAVSLIPPMLVLHREGKLHLATAVLKRVVKWVADRYDADGRGLAGPQASPEEEVEYLLGDPFEHVKIEPRAESYIATVVQDLAAMLKIGDLFNIARNEFLAVGAFPSMIEVPDTASLYSLEATGIRYTANMEFADSWTPIDGWKVASHHHRAAADYYYLERIDRQWDLLAISAVLRDRHFLETCRYFLGKAPQAHHQNV